MIKKKLLVFSIVFFSITFNSFSIEPDIFVQSTVNRASKLLGEDISKNEKIEKLKLIAKETVDIKGIGFYTLGKYRKELKDDELERYTNLFEKYFLKSFTSRLSDYSDPKIEVISAEVLNPKYTIVKSLLLATDKKPEVKIDWRIYTKNPDKPLIRDLIVEGLSLARTQKEEFSSILNSNNNDLLVLISKLEEFVKN